MVFASVGVGGGVGDGAHLPLLFIPISPLKVLFLPRTHVSGEGYTQHLCSEQTFRDCGLIKQTKSSLLCKHVARHSDGQQLTGRRKVMQRQNLGSKTRAGPGGD